YMIRADVLRKLGWSTSITEDWELTIRLYLAGYKVLYTPYIQAPAECVSTVRRLIKQRMRWAEGHTYNVKKYFFQIIGSPNLSFKEKLEFCFYAPYYLQSVLFSFGTVTWLLGTFVFHQKLPMWGELFGWSLIVSNTLALPLMNLAGVLLEGSLRRDAFGLLSFIATDLAIPAVLGTAVPLLVLALFWLRLRRRFTALALAFTLGLGTNVAYLAQAVPAVSATDNSSVFTFARTGAFLPGGFDMK